MKQILLFLLIFQSIFAKITSEQRENLQIARNIGQICLYDGESNLNETLPSIMLQESSAISNSKGDDGKSIGLFQFQLATIRDMQRRNTKFGFLQYYSDKMIMKKLIDDPEFSSVLACELFKMNYREAKALGLSDPKKRAIMRHNGGFKNTNYIRKVLERQKFIKKLIRKGELK